MKQMDAKKRKAVNTTLNKEYYDTLQLLALKLSAERGSKINTNDLIEEGMEMILKKYENKLK